MKVLPENNILGEIRHLLLEMVGKKWKINIFLNFFYVLRQIVLMAHHIDFDLLRRQMIRFKSDWK